MTPTPGLLLLHGAGDSGACWDPFVDRLRRLPGLADLQVLTPDAPAHGGRRAQPGQTIAWPDLIADATAHAEALVARTGRPIVCAGHSMGAMTALGVSAYRPDLVAATFLEDPPLLHALAPTGSAPIAPEPVDVHEFADWFSDLQSKPLADVIAFTRAEHPTWDADEYEPWARAKQAVDIEAFAAPVLWVHADTERVLRTASTPVVLVAGLPELGGLVAPEAWDALAALPGWNVHRLPTGHDVRRDAPEQTTSRLAALIRSVGG